MPNADSFEGKLLLLIVDKIVIGALIAMAIFLYDRYKTRDNRLYEAKREQTQLAFERSRVIKEFLPVIQDPKTDLTTRAYILRSAVLTGSIDPDAAFEIGQDFLRGGLQGNHFVRLVSTMVPQGIGSLSRRGVQIADEWYKSFGDLPDLDTTFDPVSGRENLPKEQAAMITEARLLRSVLYERLASFDTCTCPELRLDTEIPAHLYGIHVLLRTRDREQAIKASQSLAPAIQIVGMINRLASDPQDSVARAKLRAIVQQGGSSRDRMRISRVLIAAMNAFASPIDSRATEGIGSLLAEIATGTAAPSGPAIEEGDVFWRRFEAAEALLRMGPNSRFAVPTIEPYLATFASRLAAASTAADLDSLGAEYASGKIVRVLVDVIGNSKSQSGIAVLRRIRNAGPDKLRQFPFLAEDLDRALSLDVHGAAGRRN